MFNFFNIIAEMNTFLQIDDQERAKLSEDIEPERALPPEDISSKYGKF